MSRFFYAKRALLCVMLCMALGLTGCMQQVHETAPPRDNMPAIKISFEAPQGDTIAARQIPSVLYYLNQDATYLVAATSQVEVASGQSQAEAVLRELFTNVPDGMRAIANPGVALQQVSNPVVISENVATVRLSAAARSLTPQELYYVRMAITNTLTEISGIDYVVVLVEGREEGLDLAATIPAGALSHYSSGDIGSLWSQIEVQQGHVDNQGVSKAVSLYLPAPGARYVVAQVRNIVFPGTTVPDYVNGILTEMGKNVGEDREMPVISNLADYLESPAEVFSPVDSTERILRLSFTGQVENAMMQQGIGRGVFLAMLTQTLVSFVPRIDALQVSIDGEIISALDGVDTVDFQDATFESGLLHYDDFLPYVGTYIWLRFPVEGVAQLERMRRAVPFAQATHPRALLRQVVLGLQPNEEQGLLPVLPSNIEDADIIAVQVTGDIALLNISTRFAHAIAGAGDPQERLMVYALVNLLCSLPQVQRVAFFVEGEQVETLGGLLEFRGVFYANPGLER